MSVQRLDVKQAAELLGISSEGVRKRIKRGSLKHEKSPDGRVYVWLDKDLTPTNDANTQLLLVIQEQVETLRQELQDWKKVVTTRDEELRRKDHIIAALTERIPELEAPSNKHKSDGTATESVKEEQEKSEPETQKTTAVPWWKRILAGTK